MAYDFDPAVDDETAKATQLNQFINPVNHCVDGSIYWGGTTAGAAPAYTCTLPHTPSMVAGQRVVVMFHATNPGSSATLNPNSEGADPIKVNGSADLSPGLLPVGRPVELIFDGTSWEALLGSGEVGDSSMQHLIMFGDASSSYLNHMAYSEEQDIIAVIGTVSGNRRIRYAERRNGKWHLVSQLGRGSTTVAQTPLQDSAAGGATNPSFIGHLPSTAAAGGTQGAFLIANGTNNQVKIVDIASMSDADQAVGTSDNNNIYSITYDEDTDRLWFVCGASQGRLVRIDPASAWAVEATITTISNIRGVFKDATNNRLWITTTGNLHYVDLTDDSVTDTGVSLPGLSAGVWVPGIGLFLGGGRDGTSSNVRIYDPGTNSVILTWPTTQIVAGSATVGTSIVWDPNTELLWAGLNQGGIAGLSPFVCESASVGLSRHYRVPREELGLAYTNTFGLSYPISMAYNRRRRELIFSCYYLRGIAAIRV